MYVLNRSHSQRFICMLSFFFSLQLEPGAFWNLLLMCVCISLHVSLPFISFFKSQEKSESVCGPACPLQPCWCECCMYRRCI